MRLHKIPFKIWNKRKTNDSKVDLFSHTEAFVSDRKGNTIVTQKPDGYNEDVNSPRNQGNQRAFDGSEIRWD